MAEPIRADQAQQVLQTLLPREPAGAQGRFEDIRQQATRETPDRVEGTSSDRPGLLPASAARPAALQGRTDAVRPAPAPLPAPSAEPAGITLARRAEFPQRLVDLLNEADGRRAATNGTRRLAGEPPTETGPRPTPAGLEIRPPAAAEPADRAEAPEPAAVPAPRAARADEPDRPAADPADRAPRSAARPAVPGAPAPAAEPEPLNRTPAQTGGERLASVEQELFTLRAQEILDALVLERQAHEAGGVGTRPIDQTLIDQRV